MPTIRIPNTENSKILYNYENIKVLELGKAYGPKVGIGEKSYFSRAPEAYCRQVLFSIYEDDDILLHKEGIQWMAGNVNIHMVGKKLSDLLCDKALPPMKDGAAISYRCQGRGTLALAPVRYYPVIEPLEKWNGLVIKADDLILRSGLVNCRYLARRVPDGAENDNYMFYARLCGEGAVVLKSSCPREELATIELSDEVYRTTGAQVIAWSKDLSFSLERIPEYLGNIYGKEKYFSVFKGTGKLLIKMI